MSILSGNFLAQAAVQTTNNTTDQHGMIVSFVIWLFVGLVAGFLASKIVNKQGDGLVLDIILGLIGSVVGGFIFNLFGVAVGGLIGSIVVAMIGAVIVLVIYHALIHKRATV